MTVTPDLIDLYLERSAGQALDVSFPERTIEVVVIPYNDEIEADVEGEMLRESVAPGAFAGIERRANRVRANREHKRELTFGRAAAFYPKRPEGLVAKVKVARTPLGDEALELAADGALDASAGFKPKAIQWLGPRRVRYTKCWLAHIAFTSEPAYESAKVLAVRSQDHGGPPKAATPNLDQVRAWLLEERYSRI